MAFLRRYGRGWIGTLLVSVLILWVYRLFSPWGRAFVIEGNAIFREFPLVLFLLFLFYFPQRRFWLTLSGVVIVVVVYLTHDIFGLMLQRSPRVSDLENLHNLFDFSLLLGILVCVVALGLLALILYSFFEFIRNHPSRVVYKHLSAKLIALFLVAWFLWSGGFESWVFRVYGATPPEPFGLLKKNGRLITMAYDHFSSREQYNNLKRYKESSLEVNKALFGEGKIENPRNVYLIVLESFIDPRLVQGLEFSRSPLFEGMEKYLEKGEFSYCTSPVFGGSTAQAEFEVLSALPALAKVKAIDFTVLDGERTGGFISFLKENHYHAYANIATVPWFFNSVNAYKSLGFEELHYLEMEGLKKRGEKYVFDGALFDYTLKQIASLPKGQPRVVYTLGMYGHIPVTSNQKIGPDVIKINRDSANLAAVTNQFYYRTKALSEYIDAIFEIDPLAILFVTSDHLPSLGKKVDHKRGIYTNICLLLDGKEGRVKWGDEAKPQYKIPTEIARRLGMNPPEAPDYQEIYYKMLADAVRWE